MLLQSVGKIEDELKQLSTRFTEKKQQLLQLQRKKGCVLNGLRLCSLILAVADIS